ncbi:MAG: hypothetical protein O4752_08995 [Trichodesmium sp. St4_bin8_1]|nr:hypothetical protein [Trichodesmium sp. St4_bin8_1]
MLADVNFNRQLDKLTEAGWENFGLMNIDRIPDNVVKSGLKSRNGHAVEKWFLNKGFAETDFILNFNAVKKDNNLAKTWINTLTDELGVEEDLTNKEMNIALKELKTAQSPYDFPVKYLAPEI